MTVTREDGNKALAQEKYEQAVEIYSQILENGAAELEKTYSNRSLAYYRQGKWTLALEDAERAIELRPDWEKGYIRKALTLDKMGASGDEVLRAYEDGLKHVPTSETLKHAAAALKDRLYPDVYYHQKVSGQKKEKDDGGTGVTWNEDLIAKHEAERGVLYGKMQIDHPDTPFLVFDAEKAKENLIGTVENRNEPPQFVDITELQQKLGLLEVRQDQGQSIVEDKEGTLFTQKRTQIYKEEGAVFLANNKE